MIFLKNIEVNNVAQGTLIIKKSKFITYISIIKNKNELFNFIENFCDKKASHNCYAYRFGEENVTYGYDNDGEPNGTAGEPLLKIIENKNLTNIVILVTRYFGGIKLGTGNLQKAYCSKAIEMLDKIKVKEIKLMYNLKINFNIENIKKISLFLNSIAEEINFVYDGQIVYCEFKLDDFDKLETIKNKIKIIKKELGYF